MIFQVNYPLFKDQILLNFLKINTKPHIVYIWPNTNLSLMHTHTHIRYSCSSRISPSVEKWIWYDSRLSTFTRGQRKLYQFSNQFIMYVMHYPNGCFIKRRTVDVCKHTWHWHRESIWNILSKYFHTNISLSWWNGAARVCAFEIRFTRFCYFSIPPSSSLHLSIF